MAARLPADLLDRSADESSRLLALTYLDEIALAEPRLADPLDPEALHDFRVGLRRLRSCIRAYRTELRSSVSKRMRRRLRKLTMATNGGRDAEVHLSWLRAQAGRLGPEHTEGLAWLIGRLEGRKFETLDTATAGVGRRFLKLAAKLRPRLEILRIEVRRGRGSERPSFRQVTGELIRSHAAELAESLKAVRGAENMAEAHEARIAAKRLRYSLEPLVRRAAGAKGLTTQLKGLQDVLGQLHDLHVISEEIASSLAALPPGPTERPFGAESGLRALERLATEEGAAAFASFEAHWGDQHGSRFLARAAELGRTLARTAGKAAEGAPSLSLAQRRRSERALQRALKAEEEKTRAWARVQSPSLIEGSPQLR
jgi:CHAD domain-containing protein